MQLIDLFVSALGFLTIFPVGKREEPNYKLFIVFPLVGFLIGLSCGYLFRFLVTFFNTEVSVLFTLILYVILTDILHLDGFSDTVDALFASLKKQPQIVFKDPHIGVAGCVYSFVIVLLKFILLKNMQDIFLAIVVLPTVSKWSLSVVGFFGRSIEWSNLGKKFIYRDIKVLIFSVAIATFCLAILIRSLVIIFLLFLTFAISMICTKFLNFKFGGVNGDMFGFVAEISEVFLLISMLMLNLAR